MSEHAPERQGLTEAQDTALHGLCDRYGVDYSPAHYTPQFDLPPGYVAGWVGGPERPKPTIYVGCDPHGGISS
jgi:hypothetical protein